MWYIPQDKEKQQTIFSSCGLITDDTGRLRFSPSYKLRRDCMMRIVIRQDEEKFAAVQELNALRFDILRAPA